MSETVDRLISDQLNQRPGARHAYHYDPTMHNDIERTRGTLAVMEAAMRREGIPYDSAERVLNEIVSAGLDGWERDKRSRERLLLLADMDPTEFRRPAGPVFTEPAEGSPVRDDVTPERMDAWLEKEQARLREATGFDLSPEERPTSSEETSG
jgi:hypothetical protein